MPTMAVWSRKARCRSMVVMRIASLCLHPAKARWASLLKCGRPLGNVLGPADHPDSESFVIECLLEVRRERTMHSSTCQPRPESAALSCEHHRVHIIPGTQRGQRVNQ